MTGRVAQLSHIFTLEGARMYAQRGHPPDVVHHSCFTISRCMVEVKPGMVTGM
jgi:hypothetical protein